MKLYIQKLNFFLNFSNISLKLNSNEVKELFINGIDNLKEIEAGDLVNKDESRMVGHFWMRDSKKAPNKAISQFIESEKERLKGFFTTNAFDDLLYIGIGGSALGPQLINGFAGNRSSKKIYFLDNTDSESFQKIVKNIKDFNKLLVVVVSKSGSTQETVNMLKLTEAEFKKRSISISNSFVAITGKGSLLDNYAKDNNFLDTFYIADWLGGRTSIWSSIGLLPLLFLDQNIDEFLNGAKLMDLESRNQAHKNPAFLLALAWYQEGKGKGDKNLVILPYKDKLELLGRYLQQLIMESIGKSEDLNNNTVNQGLTVYGNKGSTDQHAFIQQLRDGRNDFIAHIISSITSKTEFNLEIDQNTKIDDYLKAFSAGTSKALIENDRSVVEIEIQQIDIVSFGALISLFENAVSFYARFININAYHQPGVEAGKKSAKSFLRIKDQLVLDSKTCKDPKALLENYPEDRFLADNALRYLVRSGGINGISLEDILEL